MADCLFCSIAAGDIPSDQVRSGERTYAFRDIAPVAPTHVLVVPRQHYRNAAELSREDPGLLAELVAEATSIADEAGLAGGYRLVFNTGQEGGQTVDHVHVHVLGGRTMTWPPG